MERMGLVRFVGKLLLFALLLPFVLEGVTRTFLPQQLIVYDQFYGEDNSGLGQFPMSNLDIIVNTGERDVRLITDQRGFRIGEQSTVANPESRILLLGDSYVQAIQVDYSQTMGALLEDKLAEVGRTVVVDNSGSANFDLNHYAIMMSRQLEATDYDLVIVLLNHTNDLIARDIKYFQPTIATTRHLRLPRSLTHTELINAIFYPVNDWLERNSQFFMLIKNRGRILLAQLGLSAYYFPWTLEKNNLERPEWAISADKMSEISALGTRYNVPVLFVLVPTSHQVDASWLDFYINALGIDVSSVDLKQPNQVLSDIVEDGIVLLDPLSDFVDRFKGGAALYGKIDAHFSPEGHQVMADVLFELASTYLD